MGRCAREMYHEAFSTCCNKVLVVVVFIGFYVANQVAVPSQLVLNAIL